MICEMCRKNWAKYSVKGANEVTYYCAKCSANLCLQNGDMAGYIKFMAVAN